MHYMLIYKICKICIYLYCFVCCTYFAYEIYIAQLHLNWSEDSVNTYTTPVQRGGIGGTPKKVYDVSWYSYRK